MSQAAGLGASGPAAPGENPVHGEGQSQSPGQIDWTRLLLGFSGMVLGQFMAILDIQIVAASLPQIQSGVGASNDEISWVQTAYLIPEVVMIPLSAFLSRIWGTQRLFLASCCGFILMSIATGLSSSIEMMIVTRALQGFVGGAMIPTVFATAFTAFPPQRRLTAGVVMGLIVTLAPTIGPTLGGHLSEALSWRWLFFINVFPGILVLFLVGRYANFDRGDRRLAANFDWAGLALMATSLMSIQFVLEEGARNDWFDDPTITCLSVLGLLSGIVFVRRSLRATNPIIELRALGDRNFLAGVAMTFVTGAALFGGTFLMPLFLGRVRDFSASEVGTTMMVSGLTMFLTGPLIGRMVRFVDLRVPMILGFALCGIGMAMAHSVTSQWGFWQFASVQAVRGVGVMMALIAAQQVTMSTLAPHLIKNASGIVNLARNVGGAFGLAVLNTTLTHQSAAHLENLSANLPNSSPQAHSMLDAITARMEALGLPNAHQGALKSLALLMERQANTLAFGDAFLLLAIACFFGIGLAWLAKPQSYAAQSQPDALH